MILFLRSAALVSNFAASFRLVFFFFLSISLSLSLHAYTVYMYPIHIDIQTDPGRNRDRKRQIYNRMISWEGETIVTCNRTLWPQLKMWSIRITAHTLTFLSVTVIYTVGVTIQSNAASPLRWCLVQSKDGDSLNHRCFLLQHFQTLKRIKNKTLWSFMSFFLVGNKKPLKQKDKTIQSKQLLLEQLLRSADETWKCFLCS